LVEGIPAVLVITLIGCVSDMIPDSAQVEHCVQDGVTYDLGEIWICDGNTNTCSCAPGNEIIVAQGVS
jgi:hypothetical protein